MTYMHCLTKQELAEITGFKHRPCQVRELQQMQIPFTTTTNGDIKVFRSNVVTSAQPRKKTRIRLEALQEA